MAELRGMKQRGLQEVPRSFLEDAIAQWPRSAHARPYRKLQPNAYSNH